MPIRRETIKCLHCDAIFAAEDNWNQNMEKNPCGSLKFKCSHCEGGLISVVIFTLHQSSKNSAKSLAYTFQSRYMYEELITGFHESLIYQFKIVYLLLGFFMKEEKKVMWLFLVHIKAKAKNMYIWSKIS